jgi:cardiolipin synthase
MDEKRLAELISDFVQTTPAEIVRMVVIALDNWDNKQAGLQQSKLLTSIQSPQAKVKLSKLLEGWRLGYQQMPAIGLAVAVQSSLITLEFAGRPSVDLVWTGPSINFPLRRTDQALIELINYAKKRLIIVSFAVYKAQAIIEAISDALKRNVEVIICLEDAEESQGKVSYSGVKNFSSSIFRMASFYYWPNENRPRTHDDRFGSLHAKFAVADGNLLFISSANLTEYAMDLNMEMGVLARNGGLPIQVERVVDELIANGQFKRVDL